MGLRRSVDTVIESFKVPEAQRHLTVSPNSDDSYISSLITTSRMYLENLTRRAFQGPQTWVWTMRGFRCAELWIPRPPLVSVTSISYKDSNGTTQTLSASQYIVSNAASEFDLGRITLAYGQFWPGTYGVADDVTITFIAGYTTLPRPLYHAQLMTLEKLYEGIPEADIQPTIDDLIGQYVVEKAG